MCIAMMMFLNLDSPAQQRFGLREAALPLHELADVGQSSRNLRVVRTQLLLPAAQGLWANAVEAVMGAWIKRITSCPARCGTPALHG